jgi:hypothetical protein
MSNLLGLGATSGKAPTTLTDLMKVCLVSCLVMLRFLSRAPVFLAFPPPPPLLLFALNLPCRLAATADALTGMVNSGLLLLQLVPHSELSNPYHAIRAQQHSGCETMFYMFGSMEYMFWLLHLKT